MVWPASQPTPPQQAGACQRAPQRRHQWEHGHEGANQGHRSTEAPPRGTTAPRHIQHRRRILTAIGPKCGPSTLVAHAKSAMNELLFPHSKQTLHSIEERPVLQKQRLKVECSEAMNDQFGISRNKPKPWQKLNWQHMMMPPKQIRTTQVLPIHNTTITIQNSKHL